MEKESRTGGPGCGGAGGAETGFSFAAMEEPWGRMWRRLHNAVRALMPHGAVPLKTLKVVNAMSVNLSAIYSVCESDMSSGLQMKGTGIKPQEQKRGVPWWHSR